MDSDATYIQDVTYGEVRSALVSINEELRGMKLDPEITLRLSNNRKELEDANEQFQDAVDEIEQHYLETDDEGNPKTEVKKVYNQQIGQQVEQEVKVFTDQEAFMNEVDELLTREISGGLRMENIAYDAFGAIDVDTLTTLREFFLTIPEDSADNSAPDDTAEDLTEEDA